MALVNIAGGVDASGLELQVADLREMRALTASCSCTAGLEGESVNRVSCIYTPVRESVGL